MIVLETKDEIEFASLASIKGALKLEILGIKRRGRSAYSIAKQLYNLKGNKQKVYDQLQKMVDKALNMK